MLRAFYLRHEKTILIAGVAAFFLGGYLGIAVHTSGGEAHTLATPLDSAIPYVAAAWPIYQSIYLLVLIPTRLFSRPGEMRAGAFANLACMAVSYAIFLLYPVRYAAPAGTSAALEGMALARGNFALWLDDRGMNCFPSLHIAMATLASLCCARADRRLGVCAWILTALIALASLLLKRHYLVDLPAGAALGALVYALFLQGRLEPAGGGTRAPAPRARRPSGGRRTGCLLLAAACAGLLRPGAAVAAPDWPVVAEARALPDLLGEPIGDLRLLAWSEGVWKTVPVQIDPRIRVERPGRAPRLAYLFTEPGGDDPLTARPLAPDDEIVFMEGDTGPRPPGGTVPPGSRRGVILQTAAGGFAGLFAFADPPAPSPRRYLRYDLSADRIRGRSYTIAFSKAHPVVFDTLRLHPRAGEAAGNTIGAADAPASGDAMSPNLVDRAKIRIRGTFLHTFPFRKNETDFESAREGVRAGPVRVVRGHRHRLPLVLGWKSPWTSEAQIFYPDGFEFPIWLAKSSGMGRLLTHLAVRAGPDWGPAALGMSVRVAGNTSPVRVDGRMDAQERALKTEGASWTVLYGPTGALLSQIAPLPDPGGSRDVPYRVYYRDDREAADPPEGDRGQIGALAYDFPEIAKLPPGAYRWVVRARILPRYRPGDETDVLERLGARGPVRVAPVAFPAGGGPGGSP
jgi:membrane-associated phospholipid phosphatase